MSSSRAPVGNHKPYKEGLLAKNCFTPYLTTKIHKCHKVEGQRKLAIAGLQKGLLRIATMDKVTRIHTLYACPYLVFGFLLADPDNSRPFFCSSRPLHAFSCLTKSNTALNFIKNFVPFLALSITWLLHLHLHSKLI